MKKIKVLTPDSWFSKCIRARNNWTCEYSGKSFPRNSQGLHCSHFHGRRNYGLRFEPLNCFAHSYASHAYLGENPSIFNAWALEQLGECAMDILQEKFNDIGAAKSVRKSLKEVSNHYRDEYHRILERRDQGETGRIEIVGYL